MKLRVSAGVRINVVVATAIGNCCFLVLVVQLYWGSTHQEQRIRRLKLFVNPWEIWA
jgi:hypothetical protein